MKKIYVEPYLRIIEFAKNFNIILASSNLNDDSSNLNDDENFVEDQY